jgi:hypothetical protein
LAFAKISSQFGLKLSERRDNLFSRLDLTDVMDVDRSIVDLTDLQMDDRDCMDISITCTEKAMQRVVSPNGEINRQPTHQPLRQA